MKISYDLETTDILTNEGTKIPLKDVEIVQFSAVIIDDKDKIIEEINIFVNDFKGTINYLEGIHENVYYSTFLRTNGITTKEMITEVKNLFKKYDFKEMITANGRDFDNKILKRVLETPSILYLLKQHDVKIYEQLITGATKFGKLANGDKVKLTLEANCKRHGIDFDESEAHDGLYDCKKTFELFSKQREVIKSRLFSELNVVNEEELIFNLEEE